MTEMTNRDMLIKLVTQFEEMQKDVSEIKAYTAKINGGLRGTQNDVTAIQTNCGNCKTEISDLRSRVNGLSGLNFLVGLIAVALAIIFGVDK
jgi:hypothetical protein